jgi:hypothetical protein
MLELDQYTISSLPSPPWVYPLYFFRIVICLPVPMNLGIPRYFFLYTIMATHKVTYTGTDFQSSELGPPTPLSARECCSSLLWVQEGDTLACGGGGCGDRIPTKGQTLWYSMYSIIPLQLYRTYTAFQDPKSLLFQNKLDKNYF